MYIRSVPKLDESTVRRVVFALSIPTIAILGIVWRYLGIWYAILGSYTLIGIILVSYIYGEHDICAKKQDHRVTVSIILFTISISLIFRLRLIPILIFLPLIYFYLVSRRPRNRSLGVLLISLSFLITPIIKYGLNGFYFGRGDTWKHSKYILDILSTDSITGIPSIYSDIPGLHLCASIISEITGLSPYDSLILLGLFSFSTILLPTYYISICYFESQTFSYYATLSLSALFPISYYATYFYPQSFALVLLMSLCMIFILYIVKNDRRFLLPYFMLTIAATISHHFMFILCLIALSGSLVVYLPWRTVTNIHADQSIRAAIVLSITASVVLYHWGFNITSFINILIVFAARGVSTFFNFGVPQGGGGIYSFGVSLSDPSIVNSLGSLFSTKGLYNISKFTIFVCGCVYGLLHWSRMRISFPGKVVGVFSAILVLQIPTGLASLQRVKLVTLFFFALVLSDGIRRSGQGSIRQYSKILVVIMLCVSGPLVASDDITAIQNTMSDDSYELQTAFSEKEYSATNRVSGFLAISDQPVSTFWITRESLSYFGIQRLSTPSVNESKIVVDNSIFVYRNEWVNYKVGLSDQSTDYLSEMVISESYLNRISTNENKIYANGKIGALDINEDRHNLLESRS